MRVYDFIFYPRVCAKYEYTINLFINATPKEFENANKSLLACSLHYIAPIISLMFFPACIIGYVLFLFSTPFGTEQLKPWQVLLIPIPGYLIMTIIFAFIVIKDNSRLLDKISSWNLDESLRENVAASKNTNYIDIISSDPFALITIIIVFVLGSFGIILFIGYLMFSIRMLLQEITKDHVHIIREYAYVIKEYADMTKRYDDVIFIVVSILLCAIILSISTYIIIKDHVKFIRSICKDKMILGYSEEDSKNWNIYYLNKKNAIRAEKALFNKALLSPEEYYFGTIDRSKLIYSDARRGILFFLFKKSLPSREERYFQLKQERQRRKTEDIDLYGLI